MLSSAIELSREMSGNDNTPRIQPNEGTFNDSESERDELFSDWPKTALNRNAPNPYSESESDEGEVCFDDVPATTRTPCAEPESHAALSPSSPDAETAQSRSLSPETCTKSQCSICDVVLRNATPTGRCIQCKVVVSTSLKGGSILFGNNDNDMKIYDDLAGETAKYAHMQSLAVDIRSRQNDMIHSMFECEQSVKSSKALIGRQRDEWRTRFHNLEKTFPPWWGDARKKTISETFTTLNSSVSTLRKDLLTLKTDYTINMNTEFTNFRSELENFVTIWTEKREKSMGDFMQNAWKSVLEKDDTLKSTTEEYTDRVEELLQQNEEKTEMLQAAQNRIAAGSQIVEERDGAILLLEQRLSEMSDEMAELQTSSDEKDSTIRAMTAAVASTTELEKKISKLDGVVDTRTAEKSLLSNELSLLKSSHSKQEKEVKTLEEKIEKQQLTLKLKDNVIEEAQKSYTELDVASARRAHEAAEYMDQMNSMRSEINKVTSRLSETEHEAQRRFLHIKLLSWSFEMELGNVDLIMKDLWTNLCNLDHNYARSKMGMIDKRKTVKKDVKFSKDKVPSTQKLLSLFKRDFFNGFGMPDAIISDVNCPITTDLLEDPVVAADGHSYDRASIAQWVRTNRTSPKTQARLPTTDLIPNNLLKRFITSMMDFKNIHTVPSDIFVCPLSKKALADPVVAHDGVSYDRQAIAAYMGKASNVNFPNSRTRMPKRTVVPNFTIKAILFTLSGSTQVAHRV